MVVSVEADDWPVRKSKTRTFEAVLICTDRGLHRLWRNGRSRLLATAFEWPALTRGEAEKRLGPLVPKAWGTQRSSGCVLRQIPPWILKARTTNLARLLLGWSRAEQTARTDRVLRDCQPMPLALPLPPAPLWRPVAITVMPSTDLVVRALHSGVLGYDNSHGYSHRHFMGKITPEKFSSYTEIYENFMDEWRQIAMDFVKGLR